MYSDQVMNLNSNDEDIVLTVFPGGNGIKSFNFYEDNGNDKNYANEYATTKLTSLRNGSEQEIIIGKRQGKYNGMPERRNFKLKLLCVMPPVDVLLNGKPLKYKYLGEEFAVLIDIPSLPCNEEKNIKIIYSKDSVNFNGLYGTVKRFTKSMEKLKYRDAYLVMKEDFAKMGSLNEAITYSPEKAKELITDFWTNFERLPDVLKDQGLNDDNINWFLQQINWNNKIK